MELKDYQKGALHTFAQWQAALATAREQSAAQLADLRKSKSNFAPDFFARAADYPGTAWKSFTGSEGYHPRIDARQRPLPHVCFKVPTGGGKTLLAAAALADLQQTTGLVLWLVPRDAIYQQTKAALWNKEHPYRQRLDNISKERVKMLEKDTPFSKDDIDNFLCVMLVSVQSICRQETKRNTLKLHRDSGHYLSLFPENDDALGEGRLLEMHPDLDREGADGPVKRSLFNVCKMLEPVIILDEAHKAYGNAKSEKAARKFVNTTLNELNPSLILELSATPDAKRSNLLVDIPGRVLKAEEMIKLPVAVTAFHNASWQYTLGAAHAELERLSNAAAYLQNSEGRYIRPIALVRVERTGKEQRDGVKVHADDVQEHLIRVLGEPAEGVRIKASGRDQLGREDLTSEYSPVRWIITKDALKEGWDCPFAYLLVLLDNTTAPISITQMVGRTLRQPEARRTGQEALDRCYVYCYSTGVGNAVERVKAGLEAEGLGDLTSEVQVSQAAAPNKVTVRRRAAFREAEIFLPKVLHQDGDGGWEELDYQQHIVTGLKWDAIRPQGPDKVGEHSTWARHRFVDIVDEIRAGESQADRELAIDKSVQVSWYTRRLAESVPNSWQASRFVAEFIQLARDKHQMDDAAIYDARSNLLAQMLEQISKAMDQQAEQVFRDKLDAGVIRFDLEAGTANYRLAKEYEVMVGDNPGLLAREDGLPAQISLFEPVYTSQFDTELESNFARYLDEQKALQWWHRVAARQRGDYYIRGWRRERIWPDFVAMAGESHGKPSVLVFETKGDHLRCNDDTKYKKRVFAELEKTFNAGKMTIHEGPAKGVFRLVFDRPGFPEAAEAMRQVAGTYKA